MSLPTIIRHAEKDGQHGFVITTFEGPVFECRFEVYKFNEETHRSTLIMSSGVYDEESPAVKKFERWLRPIQLSDLTFFHRVDDQTNEISAIEIAFLIGQSFEENSEGREQQSVLDMLIELTDAHSGMSGPEGDYWAELWMEN